jgi:hypothetical protein
LGEVQAGRVLLSILGRGDSGTFRRPVLDYESGDVSAIPDIASDERVPEHGQDEAYWEQLQQWQEAPFADLRTEDVRKTLAGLNRVIQDLDAAARFETCDWQSPIRDVAFWNALIPEIQQCRTYARMLAVHVRWQIAEGRYDDAVRSLRNGDALARNVADGPFVVQGLVGVAIVSLMNEQLTTFIQQPDAPNLPRADRAPPAHAVESASAVSDPTIDSVARHRAIGRLLMGRGSRWRANSRRRPTVSEKGTRGTRGTSGRQSFVGETIIGGTEIVRVSAQRGLFRSDFSRAYRYL